MSLSARVLATIRRYGLLPPGGRVVVALSGGGDSVALVHLLSERDAAGELILAGAAHFNHQIRGAAADEDERFCVELTRTLGLPLEVGRADVPAMAARERRSLEDAARRARYDFLARAATALGADAVATAHTRDDQAETFLLRLVRGAGTRGLAAIQPRAGIVIRPLLEAGRAELRAYLNMRGLPFREDETNADVRNPRNRVRHAVLPYLAAHCSPAIVDVLAREAALARIDEQYLQARAIETAASVVLQDEPARVVVDAGALAALDPAIASRVAREVLARLAVSRPIGSQHVDRLLELARDRTDGRQFSLPGQTAARRGGRIELEPRRTGKTAQLVNSFSILLSIPGEVVLGPAGWAVAAEPLSRLPGTLWAGRGPSAAVAASRLVLPLTVRNRRPGDRFRPLGAPGGRKLQDFLVDRKVPRTERDRLPLVVDGQDRIVWVAGQAVAEDFRVTDPAKGVLLLTVRRLGGEG
ncbi:MAG TPA: tRNA lysidine(34) synthetase TilS [Vicinamibacterales bacterium]|nr:tRNA lysidine(34) synthetase TilS [Vicinamibacterales bacterium]